MKKALVVGINDYPNAALTGCVNDASEISELLSSNSDGAPNFDVHLELNVTTKVKLKKMIIDLFSGGSDTVLFYFSGHGYINEIGGYLVTPDFQEYDEGISMDEILTIVNDSRAKDKIVILDCCHSGAMGSPTLTRGPSHITEGVSILTASRDNEPSTEIHGHGIFTNLLLEALRGGASDLRGNISPGGIYAFIDQSLGPWKQRPVFKTNVTRFTSLRYVQPQVSIETIRKLTQYFDDPFSEYQLNPSFEDTNTIKVEHQVIEPYANTENVKIFKDLQKLQSIGLIVPLNAEYMYFAAMNSKSCKLTALGHHYWRLVKERRI